MNLVSEALYHSRPRTNDLRQCRSIFLSVALDDHKREILIRPRNEVFSGRLNTPPRWTKQPKRPTAGRELLMLAAHNLEGAQSRKLKPISMIETLLLVLSNVWRRGLLSYINLMFLSLKVSFIEAVSLANFFSFSMLLFHVLNWVASNVQAFYQLSDWLSMRFDGSWEILWRDPLHAIKKRLYWIWSSYFMKVINTLTMSLFSPIDTWFSSVSRVLPTFRVFISENKTDTRQWTRSVWSTLEYIFVQ